MIRRILFVLSAGLALVVTTGQVAHARPARADGHGGGARLVSAAGPLVDLRPSVADPTDGVRAAALSVVTRRHTATVLVLSGFPTATAGRTFGAHVHSGPCVPGDGAAAGPHFNTTGQPPTEISPRTEVWLDFTVTRRGYGQAVAVVPFAIPRGAAGSIVVHEQPTDDAGAAGPRLACLGMPY